MRRAASSRWVAEWARMMEEVPATEFVGYTENAVMDAKVVAIVAEGQQVEEPCR